MSQVEEIKNKVDIVEIIRERLELKRAGRNWKALCPFHSEKTASFMVSPERQVFKCFGCGEGGDVFTFLEKYEGMSFLEALEYLAERVGVKLEGYKPTKADVRRKRLLAVMDLASEFYSWVLRESKVGERAREYLRKRGLTEGVIKTFSLGYAPRAWRSVSEFLIKKKGYRVADLEAVGLVIKGDGGKYYDRFRGRVIFPLRDVRGRVVGFSGRVIEGDKEAKYINTPETELYHKRELLYGLYENKDWVRKRGRIVLVEGEMDMLMSWLAGVKEVGAIKGSAFTEEQARLLARYTKNIVLALDADEAGVEAMKRAMGVAEKLNLQVKVVSIRGGKDPAEVARESFEQWRTMVKQAVSYYDFLIEMSCRKWGVASGEGASKISEEVVPVLAGISNVVVKDHYVKKLAKRLGVKEEVIYQEMMRQEKKSKLSSLREEVKKIEQGGGRRERLEEYLLALLLQEYEKVKDELAEVEEEWFTNPAIRKIMRVVQGWQKEKFTVQELSRQVGEELDDALNRGMLRDLSELTGDEVKEEFRRVRREIEEYALKERLSELGKEMAKMEKEGREEEWRRLGEEFNRVKRRLAEIK